MYEIAICDDEILDREFLKADICRSERYDGMIRFHEYGSGAELLKDMEEMDFSLIFMDIQMDGMDGEETAREIRKLDDSVILVFWTGYAEPGVHSFEVQPYRFIKKNMADEDRLKYIEASLDKMASVMSAPWIQVKYGRKTLYLRADDIVYMEKGRKHVRMHISEQAKMRYGIEPAPLRDIRCYEKLDDLYEKLKPYGYGRPHSSYVVNLKFLMACRPNAILLEGGSEVNISHSKAAEFNQIKRKFLTEKYTGRGER